MRIHILYSFTDKPWGGGNQFLKALRNAFIAKGLWVDDPVNADVILFNSHSFLEFKTFLKLISVVIFSNNKILIHRVDGPIFNVRGKDFDIDKFVFQCNHLLANGTIFQSHWSQQECLKLGLRHKEHESVIINAPDKTIFYPSARPTGVSGKRIKIISTSWSSNMRKGFGLYQYLDKNLDFSRYEMTFVGNSPISFKNIRVVPPQESKALADLLREHELYVTASRNDPCSNSLLEALSCGLPAIVLNSGGHPELLGGGGLSFSGEEDVLDVISSVAEHLERYRSNICVPNIDMVADRYACFCEKVFRDVKTKSLFLSCLLVLFELMRYKVKHISLLFTKNAMRICSRLCIP